MHVEIRQKVLSALQEASAGHCQIVIEGKDQTSRLLQCDVTCFPDHLEGTDHDGNWVEISYADIEDVSVGHASSETV